MMRELLWAIASLGGALMWLLWNTRDQGPLLDDLLNQETLWVFAMFYASTVLARIVWWALRAVARAMS